MGVEVKVILTMNKQSIMIDCFDGTPDCKITLEAANLHVPVAEMSGEVFTEFDKTLQSKVAKLRFRRVTCTILSIGKNVTNYESNVLYGE